MLVRKSWNISDINELDMHDFHMRGFEAGDNIDILLITGDRGYYNHYRVEIRFFSIAYIGCPTYFFGPDFVWRMPTEEEKREIQAYAYPLPNAQVYCIDSRHNPPKKFFLASASVEVTLFYPDSSKEEFSTWGEEGM